MSILQLSNDLFEAIQSREYEKAKMFLQNGANPNRLLLNGITPFHLAVAVKSASSEYVNLILDYGGNPNVQDVEGITPFHVAAQWGKADCLELLFQHGADISITDKEGRDVTWFAKDNCNCRIILQERLKESVSDISCFTKSSAQTNLVDNNHKFHARETTTLSSSRKWGTSSPISPTVTSKVSEDTEHIIPTVPIPCREMHHYALDATSPDNCVFYLKSTASSKINLHDTILCASPNQYHELPASEESSMESCDSISSEHNEYLPEEVRKRLLFSTKFNPNASFLAECKHNSSLHSPAVDINGKCSSAVGTSAKSTSFIVNEENDSTLADSTQPVQASARNLHKPNHESSNNELCFSSSSDFTLANSTLPVELSALSLSNSVPYCPNERNNPSGNDFSLTYSFHCQSQKEFNSSCINDSTCTDLTIPVEESPRSVCATSCFAQNDSLASSIPSFKTNQKSLKETSSCSNDEDTVRVVYSDEDGFSLVEYYTSPSSSLLSTDDLENSLPIKLSVSMEPLNDSTIIYDWQSQLSSSSLEEIDCTYESGEDISIPNNIDSLTDDQIRQKLLKYGSDPGPIRHARKAYKKRLCLLEKGLPINSGNGQVEEKYSRELRDVLLGKALDPDVIVDDVTLRKEFDDPKASHCYRGWAAKDSFNYLLLDPRVTKNLPVRAKSLSEAETLKIFAGATFYVGKGKKSRPYAHFKEALRRNKNGKNNRKIQHIRDIWNNNCGVVSLHVFQNVINDEAFTREAAIIDAFGLDNLTNCMRGKAYGSASAWSPTRVRRYGSFLILSAMQMLLLDGERQIRHHQVVNKQ